MDNGSRWWEIATLEKAALVGGAVGLAEGLRAVAATSDRVAIEPRE
jgi:hypothetical protein